VSDRRSPRARRAARTSHPTNDLVHIACQRGRLGEPELTNYHTTTTSPTGEISLRKVAFIAGIALLLWTLLSSFADFGVLQGLVVPGDGEATVERISSSIGPFRIAIAAFLVVTILNVVIAWALTVLLAPANQQLALLTGWLRLAAAAVFGVALANLLDVARLVDGGALGPALDAQAMASIASFYSGWDLSLAIFGIHLVGLGTLLLRSSNVPRFLSLLVMVAGVAYLADSLAAILVPDLAFAPSVATFFGQSWLTFWLLWRGLRGFPPEPVTSGAVALAHPAKAAS
jgi:Domain of unknown function (DUF4386)